jgi:hypothetical protein
MNLDSARELKALLLRSLVSDLGDALLRRRALPMAAQDVRALDGLPRTMALGVAPAGRGDYKLALRLQSRALEDSRQVEIVRRRARGEVDVRYVGRISKRAAPPWHRTRRRPLVIGCSIAHHRVTAGTLGGFVILRAAGEVRALSNNHVLADEGRGRRGDAVLQPGPLDGGRVRDDRVGELAQVVALKKTGINHVDAALASLRPRLDYDPRALHRLGTLSAPGTLPLEQVTTVSKLGRTTGLTRGRVTAFELDNLVVAYDTGNLRFDDQIEVDGEGAAPFSQGGDSGAMVFTSQGRQAVALLFAGSDQGGRSGQGLTYANPLRPVLDALKADLLT